MKTKVAFLCFLNVFIHISCNINDSNSPMPEPLTYEGKTYATIEIGNQVWMAENLDIGVMLKNSFIQTDNGIIEKYCWNDDSLKCKKYGGLYQWNEAMQYDSSNNNKGICPPGWHIPTLAEFYSLAETVDWDANRLKTEGVGVFDGYGTNTSGFSALLSGCRSLNGGFSYSERAIFWTSSIDSSTSAPFQLFLYWDDNFVYSYPVSKKYGFSIRCLKD